MANLKTLSGFPIQNLTSDPVPYAQALADNPYVGAWASGTNVNTARRSMASAGTQTASIITGGLLPPGTYAITEQWNGSAWTEVADLNTGRWYFKGSGTSTAALAYGGVESDPTASAKTELWNGSGWTETGDLNTARQKMGNSTTGTTTASIAFGGSPSDPAGGGALTINESWNGSAWTEVGDLNSARKGLGGSGTSTAALAIAGNVPPVSALNESWNGSAWTEVGDLNTAREQGGTAGTQTSAITWSGYPDSPGVLTESWNGSAWTEVADLANKQIASGSAGVSNESAAAIAGYNGTANIATVEEWSFSGLNPATTPAADYSDAIVGQMYYNSTSGQFKAIKTGVGSWASGTSMPSASAGRGMAAPTTAAIAYGGTGPPGTASQTLTEYYDGSSWSEQADLNQGRFMGCPATLGSQTAALFAAGSYNGTDQANVESWNGSAWSEVNNVPTAKHSYAAGAGTQTAALAIGAGPTNIALVSTWDGSNWTDVAELNTGRYFNSAAGTQTAGITFSGDTGPPTFTANTETYNGSSWTEVAELNTARATGGGAGTQTSALMITGNTYPPIIANVEQWDGTSWTEVADVSTARIRPGSTGATASNAMIAGGQPPYMANVEEWEIPDFAINTVTTS